MASYLKPHNKCLSIEQKKELFSYRNRMLNISANFSSKETNQMCLAKCGKYENMEHIYNCEILNNNILRKHTYSDIFNGNLTNQIEAYKNMKHSVEERQKLKDI